MAFTEYEIQTSVIPTGTLKISVWADALIPFLPADDTIIEIGEITEGFDIENGWVQAPTCEVTFLEDYNADWGFWYQALGLRDLEVRLQLDEGSGYNDIFWGSVDRIQGFVDELDTIYDAGTTTGPTSVGKFSLVDILAKRLWATKLSDVLDDIIDNARYTESSTAYPTVTSGRTACAIKVGDLIASMLYVSGMNASFSAADVSWRSSGEFQVDGTQNGSDYVGYDTIDNMYIIVGYKYTGAFNRWETTDTTDADYLPNRFFTAGEFLETLCRNLAVVPRRYYSSGRHKVYLESRGNAGAAAAATLVGTMTSSKFYPIYPVNVESVQVTNSASEGYIVENNTVTAFSTTDGRSADINGYAHFISWAEGSNNAYRFLIKDGTEFYTIDNIKYYDYTDEALSSSTYEWTEALAAYLWVRLYGEGKCAFERTYSDARLTVSAVSSVIYSHIGQTISITSRGDTSVYYAVQVAKDIYNNTLRVLWFQV